MSPWLARLDGFGWDAYVVDGHDHDALEAAFRRAPPPDRPTAVVADIPEGEW